MDGQVDLAVRPALHNPFDPYTGTLITQRVGDRVEIVEAGPKILLACDFLWDIVANAALFASWCQLTPPVSKLNTVANFAVAPGFSILGLDLPTNRPSPTNRYPMCQHWTMRLTVGSRVLAYTIGSYRPSLGAMEADSVIKSQS